MPVDFKKLTLGEIVVVAAGLLLLIFSFFHWYGAGGSVKVFGQDVNVGFHVNGWDRPDAFFSIVAILIGVIMVVQILVTKLGNVSLPDKLGTVGWGMTHLVLGVIAFVFILLKLIMNTDYTEIGIFLALIASAGLAAGGFLIAKERGELPAAIGGKS